MLLQAIRKEYIVIDEQLVDFINLYFLIDNNWYCSSFGEGESNFSKIEDSLVLLNEEDENYSHKIISVPIPENLVNIINISTMSFNNFDYGLLIEFENNDFITFFEDNDEHSYLYFMKFIYQENTNLKKIEF